MEHEKFLNFSKFSCPNDLIVAFIKQAKALYLYVGSSIVMQKGSREIWDVVLYCPCC
jgi:hypothetical protein